VVERDTVADESPDTSTTTGPIAMPGVSTLPITGRHIGVKAMQLMQMRDGKVVRH
jgi:hypothetical protein